MSINNIFSKQISQIREGGITVFYRKIKICYRCLPNLPLYIIALPIVLLVRLMSPFYLIRFGLLFSSRIGHFAANTEIYLCEKDAGINVPDRPYLDIFFFGHKFLCNKQLAKMWKRTLRIWPAWICGPIYSLIGFWPGGLKHQVDQNTQHDRDVHNLLDKYPAHLRFTKEEESTGLFNLNAMGIPSNAPFVCIIVRDKGYLNSQILHTDWSYHNYRDSSIKNFVLAAEELVARGYYVIRMGTVVENALSSDNPKIIDYAFNGMRSDFMDIYLGAKCSFCVSTGTGWDAVPSWLFRKPTVFTNFVPFGYIPTFREDFIYIIKHHIDLCTKIELSFPQIFERGVGYCMISKVYSDNGVILIENTEEEIRDVVLEMEERLTRKFNKSEQYSNLQSKFLKIFPSSYCDEKGIPLHGKILGSFGYKFLKNNQDLII